VLGWASAATMTQALGGWRCGRRRRALRPPRARRHRLAARHAVRPWGRPRRLPARRAIGDTPSQRPSSPYCFLQGHPTTSGCHHRSLTTTEASPWPGRGRPEGGSGGRPPPPGILATRLARGLVAQLRHRCPRVKRDGTAGLVGCWIKRRRRRHRTAGEFGRTPRSRLTGTTAERRPPAGMSVSNDTTCRCFATQTSRIRAATRPFAAHNNPRVVSELRW